jgi:hypothetical protein
MTGREYGKGFAAGWFAASQAILNAIGGGEFSAASTEMAGDKPTARRRGRPPKSPSMKAQPSPIPAKRPRGRPRKAA